MTLIINRCGKSLMKLEYNAQTPKTQTYNELSLTLHIFEGHSPLNIGLEDERLLTDSCRLGFV